MKRIKSVNGYTIYEATTQRDADNYNCSIGNYNIYLSTDIRDFGLRNSYPEYEDIDSLAVALAMCSASHYGVAVALADELSDSTVQDMDLTLEIERRLESGEALETIRRCYDRENGILYTSISDAIDHGYDPYSTDFDPYEDHPAVGYDEDGRPHIVEDECEWDDDDLDGDLEDVLEAAMADGDLDPYPDDYDYEETELLCRAMIAAGYGFMGTDRQGELLRFADGNLQNFYFTDWPEVREWLEGVVFDDPDVGDAVERILHPERFSTTEQCPVDPEPEEEPKQERRSHASYAVLQDPDDGQYYTISAPSTEGFDTQARRDDWLLCAVAKHHAFNDCGGYDVVEVVVDGRRVEYVGWQPGMLFEFVDCETDEIVWSASFPEWDH